MDNAIHQGFPVDVSGYEYGVELTTEEITERKIELPKMATKAKTCINRGERGVVDAYVDAGKILNTAKLDVKRTGQLWGTWLEEQGIPARTASRAMKFFREPESYREDRAKEALAMREKRKEIGPTLGRNRLLMNIIKDATAEEVDDIIELIEGSDRLYDLAQRIQERTKSNGSAPADQPSLEALPPESGLVPAPAEQPSPEALPPESDPVPAPEDHSGPEASSAAEQPGVRRDPDPEIPPIVSR